MARSYGDKFLVQLNRDEGNTLGVQLGRLCVQAKIPAVYVAVALETSGTSVYSWFRGQGIRENKRRTVEVFMDLVREDITNGRLPAKSRLDAKAYIEGMVGVKI